jgi:uncharacterized protein (TIGR03435 family)
MLGTDASRLNSRATFLLCATLLALTRITLAQRASVLNVCDHSQALPASAAALVYDVASIRPHPTGDGSMSISEPPHLARLTLTGVSMSNIVQLAYGLNEFQLLGSPSWIQSQRFDLLARSDSTADDILAKLTPCQQRLTKEHMLQLLLADRAHLAIHHGSKEVSGYSLVLAKSGPKLHESAPDPDPKHGGGMSARSSKLGYQLTANRYGMDYLAAWLADETHSPVADKTGLTAKYDLALQWSEDLNAAPAAPTAGDTPYPLIFTALQEQLGLKLEPAKVPLDTITIDHIDPPTEN